MLTQERLAQLVAWKRSVVGALDDTHYRGFREAASDSKAEAVRDECVVLREQDQGARAE